MENSFALIVHLNVRDNSSKIQVKGTKLLHRLRKVFFYSIWSFDNEKSLTRFTPTHTLELGILPSQLASHTRTRRTSMKHWLHGGWLVGGHTIPHSVAPPGRLVLFTIDCHCWHRHHLPPSLLSGFFMSLRTFVSPASCQYRLPYFFGRFSLDTPSWSSIIIFFPFCWNVSNYTFRPSF